jgi:hypothetical protein
MKRVQALLGAIVGGFLLLHVNSLSAATTCIASPPLKPVHRICGIVYFSSGDRVTIAKVTVLQAGKEIAEQPTGVDGKFAFDQLKPGNYELRVGIGELPYVSTQVVLIKPQANPKLEIAVDPGIASPCWGFSLVSSKKFEAGLKPISSS